MNDLPATGRKPQSQHVENDAETRAREEKLRALRIKLGNEPLFQNAVKASRRLAEKGCDVPVLMGLVGRVAGYKRGNGRRGFRIPSRQAISRKVRSIEHQLRKLSKQTAELRAIWGFWEHMVDADTFRVPEELEKIAAKLSCISTEGFGDWFPQRDAIIDLLEQVRTTTGRAHYPEISTLINAELVWRAEKNGKLVPNMQFDADSLKMIFKRQKARQAAVARKRSEMKQKVEAIESVQYSPRQIFGLDPD
jgi:hypothetical protein